MLYLSDVKSFPMRKELRSFKDANKLSEFVKLTIEVLETIFDYVKCNDIFNLALTSKSINSIISRNAKVMRRFKMRVIIDSLKSREFSIDNRNYLTVNMPFMDINDFPRASRLLRNFVANVKEIYLDYVTVHIVEKTLFRGLKKQRNIQHD